MYIAHISDLHIGDPQKPGIRNLQKAVRCINNLCVPLDCVLVTGDLTHNRVQKNYQKCFDELNKLKTPYYVITGNHDSSEGLIKALRAYYPFHPQTEFEGKLQYVVDKFPVRLIGIDTYKENSSGGEVCKEQLDWLREKLDDNPEKKPVIVMVHQFTRPAKLTFFDTHMGGWFEHFNYIIADHADTVKLVACGHLHNSLIGSVSGVPMISTFSTNWQAYLDFREREYLVANKLPVGFYLHRYENGELMSYVVTMTTDEC